MVSSWKKAVSSAEKAVANGQKTITSDGMSQGAPRAGVSGMNTGESDIHLFDSFPNSSLGTHQSAKLPVLEKECLLRIFDSVS
jgi:hypothetical protein